MTGHKLRQDIITDLETVSDLSGRFRDLINCTHCGRPDADPEGRHMDHVFPKSWYSRTATPPNEEKPQVPSCEPCNKALGKMESRLLRVLPLAVSPENKLAADAYATLSKSMDPSAGKSEKDAKAREQAAQALRRRMVILEPNTAAGFGMVPSPETLAVVDENARVVGHRALYVQPEDQVAFVRKMLRGFVRWHYDYLLPIDAKISFQQLDRSQRAAHAADTEVCLEQMQRWRLGGGSLVYSMGWVPGQKDQSHWTFHVWDELGYIANLVGLCEFGIRARFINPSAFGFGGGVVAGGASLPSGDAGSTHCAAVAC